MQYFCGMVVLGLQGNIKMINITIDNLTGFYIVMAIVGLGFAILIAFGQTEEKSRKRST